MTESEVIELINDHSGNAVSSFTIYLTLTFGYLTGLYVIGKKLVMAQIISITLLYLMWSAAFALSALAHLDSIESLVQEYPAYIRSELLHLPWTAFGITVSIGGILICLYYGNTMRKESTVAGEENT